MAITRRTMRGITPAQVFDVLCDGKTYEHWVVGARMIRAVDPGWPTEGTRLHYTLGYGPLRKEDVTVSCRYVPDERLELEAYVVPAGTAHIALTATPAADGTVVTIDERPLTGLVRVLHNPVLSLLITARNVETLRRLETQVRGR
jgi:hypothetical protein